MAVPFASPPNAGILQQRLQDHEGRQEIEGRALEVLEDSELGSGKFGRRFNLGSPEQHHQARKPFEDHEGNPFLRVLAHGGRQNLEGPQDYEPGTPISGSTLRPFALQLPVFGGLEERSLQFNEGKEFCTTFCFTYLYFGFLILVPVTVRSAVIYLKPCFYTGLKTV